MKQGQDIAAKFPGLFIIHQKIRGNEVSEHDHDEHEIFLPLQGEIQIAQEKQVLRAGPGKMIYLPPQTPHTFAASKNAQGERIIVIIEDQLWKKNQGGKFSSLVVTTQQLFKELLFHLLVHPETKAYEALCQTLIQTLSEALDASPLQGVKGIAHLHALTKDDRIAKALDFISTCFGESVTTDAIAKACGMSVRNFNRLFIVELGVSPKQVITLYRVEAAKKFLKEKRMSVTDVAFEVGYNSVSQFITTFRTVTGKLPSDFQ